MLSFLSRFLLLLTVAVSLTGQTKISELTELATTPASTDILVIVDIGSPNVTKKITVANFLSSIDADNIDTGDLAAARMTTNIVSAFLTASGCGSRSVVIVANGGGSFANCNVLSFAPNFALGAGGDRASIDFNDNSEAAPSYVWAGRIGTGMWSSDVEQINFSVEQAEKFRITTNGALIQDQTAVTGDTEMICQGGAGETGNCFEVKNNAGTTNFGIDEDGFANQTGVAFANLGSPSDGTWIYCSDCEQTNGATDNTCTSSGTGAFAFRVNSTWRCVGSEGP